MEINKSLLDNLLEQAAASPRLRMNYDLRTSLEDGSQRMLNAMLPGTVLPIHRHTKTTEVLVLLEAGGDVPGLSIPVGQWHGINVLEPTVILECKDGKYEPLGPEDMISL